MADLYSVLPGLQVSDNEIMEAELIATQILQAKYPDLDLREGTAARDLAIRPAATIMALINKGLVYYFVQNTIKGVNDTTPTELLDKLMSNWFLSRKLGTRAVISARLFFARQKDVVVSSDIFFSPDNILKYFPASTVSILKANLTLDSFSNEYYCDVELTAEQEGSTYNVSTGSLLYFSNFDPYFLRAEINYLISSSVPTELNSEFITRAKTAISTRNLINIPSIISKLQEDFPNILDIVPIGFGDAEMIRDQVISYVPTLSPPQVLIHNGGMVDVYSRTPLATGIVQIPTDSTGKCFLGGAVYSFSRSPLAGSAVNDTVPYYITKTISGITRSSTTATASCTGHGFSTGDSITIIGTTNGYNGTYTITNTGANSFTFPVSSSLATPATTTTTITANKQLPYTVSNTYGLSFNATSVTSALTVATVTRVNHGISVGRWVQISGASQTEYNGTYLVTGATADTFTYTFAGSGTSPATGTIAIKYTDPQKDLAFSNRGSQTIDFGVTYANATASFTINYFTNMDGLDDYLSDTSRKVLCADLLPRGFNLYKLDVTVTGYNGPAPDSATCTTVVTKYLTDLDPGQTFVMADLLSVLYAAGITTIKTPLTITYTYYNRDLITPKTGTITDYLDPVDRTAIFELNSLTTDNAFI